MGKKDNIEEKKDKEEETVVHNDMEKKYWYNSINFISNTAIILIVLIIILSQAFAVKNALATEDIFRSLFNHNSLYLLGLIYFLPLKMKSVKKYVNYFNVFLITIYFIYSVTSVLTVIQSFGINSIIGLCINLFFLIYMVHSLLINTKIWKEFKLDASPFNEISSENYFYAIVVLAVILVAVNLIESSTFDGVIISLLSSCYTFILARYLYLYQYDSINAKDELVNDARDLPKVKSLVRKITSSNLNGYQMVAVVIFCICFVMGIIFGNLFPSCSSGSNLYTSECSVTEFNFSLTMVIWFASFLISVFFYGLGSIIELLESINSKLDKKK